MISVSLLVVTVSYGVRPLLFTVSICAPASISSIIIKCKVAKSLKKRLIILLYINNISDSLLYGINFYININYIIITL
jgi:hypothetical protein